MEKTRHRTEVQSVAMVGFRAVCTACDWQSRPTTSRQQAFRFAEAHRIERAMFEDEREEAR